ncbi:PEP-CTERM sorting domain-containing protein [Kiritimatiellaeota bacterium B1221]|nr:PEP-CTERM sorting domain-containing protein [Kiritimatiellaeota bacterium B1221]
MTLHKFCLPLFSALFLQAAATSAATIATWDNWTDTTDTYDADSFLAGFSASIDVSGTSSINTGFGSNDGTFGENLPGAATNANSLLLSERNGSNTLIITLTNNSGLDVNIDSFHFDFAPRENAIDNNEHGYDAFTLTYTSGGLGPDSTAIDNKTGLPLVIFGGTNKFSDYPDYDYNLSDDLSDITLGNGESAIFTMEFSGNTNGTEGPNTSSVIDNMAFQGSVIPEPSTLILLVSSLMGYTFYRRQR